MLRYYETDENGYITVTSCYGKPEGMQFDFPEDFDFNNQSFYRIIDGVLTEDTEALTAAECAELSSEMRAKRNMLLSRCDWTQNADSPLTAEKQAQWAQYRQALRDIPQQEGFPYSAVFPDAP